jgi:hypothetical protein
VAGDGCARIRRASAGANLGPPRDISGQEQHEHGVIAGGEREEAEIGRRSRGAGTEQGPHDQAEIEGRNVHQVALRDVRPSAQPGAAHAAASQDVRERPRAQHRGQHQRDPATPDKSRWRLA